MEIGGLIVRGSILPTPIEDAEPFESKRTQDGMVFFARAFLASIVGFGPIAIDDRLPRPFHQTLAEELGRMPAPMGPDLTPAFFAHRSDPAIFLQGSRVGITLEQIAKDVQYWEKINVQLAELIEVNERIIRQLEEIILEGEEEDNAA